MRTADEQPEGNRSEADSEDVDERISRECDGRSEDGTNDGRVDAGQRSLDDLVFINVQTMRCGFGMLGENQSSFKL